MSTKTEANPLQVMNVSARDRAIYEAVVIGCKSQRAVAIEHQLTQPRVSAIVKRVTRWLSQGAPPGLGEIYRRDRLRMVSRVHRLRLEKLYRDTYAAWEKSGEPTRSIKERTVKGVVVFQETTVHTAKVDRKYVTELREIEDRIVAFEGFDKRGQVEESCDGRVYEEPERTPVDTFREVKRRTILGGFDTPGDEGIPGMWEEEMKQRNAEVGKVEVGKVEVGKVEVGKVEVGNAECGVRSEREGRSEKVEGRSGEGKDSAASHSLSSVLRGEGRGEGPVPQVEAAKSEDSPQNPANTSTITEQSANQTASTSAQLLSTNSGHSAQVQSKSSVTNPKERDHLLSSGPPKGLRFRLMGTAAEMADSLGYDDFFRPEIRAARAYEAARAAARSQEELS
jgi:hypothetical protein